MFNNKKPNRIKWLFPAMALVAVCIAAISFKSQTSIATDARVTNDKVYQFTGNAQVEAEVTNPANWQFAGTTSPCSDIDEPMACTIVVDAAHATGSTLAGSGISITADNDLNASYFRVTEAEDGSYAADPFNQEP